MKKTLLARLLILVTLAFVGFAAEATTVYIKSSITTSSRGKSTTTTVDTQFANALGSSTSTSSYTFMTSTSGTTQKVAPANIDEIVLLTNVSLSSAATIKKNVKISSYSGSTYTITCSGDYTITVNSPYIIR